MQRAAICLTSALGSALGRPTGAQPKPESAANVEEPPQWSKPPSEREAGARLASSLRRHFCDPHYRDVARFGYCLSVRERGNPMKKFALLAALAIGPALIPQTSALADVCSNCAVEQPDTIVLPPTPEEGSCSTCAVPTTQPQRLACGSSDGCAVDQPDVAPIIRQEPRDCGSSGCALPAPAPQRLAEGCSNCVVD